MENNKYLLITIILVFVAVSFAFYKILANKEVEFDYTLSIKNNETNNIVTLFDNNEKGAYLDNIFIYYDGKPILLGNILTKSSKLYIPLNKFIISAGGVLIENKNELSVSLKNNVLYDIKDGIFYRGDRNIKLSNAFICDDNYYISVFDLCESLSLFCDWDNNTKTISFFSGYNIEQAEFKKGNRPALIRLEDIAPMDKDASSNDDLLKQRVIADYLYSKNIPFAVSVVPRYINPNNGIDNEPSEKYSFYNAQFVYTLDYYIGRGGVIGAHGYTHQHNNGQSLFDKEFGHEVKLSLKESERRIDLAVEAFKKMDISVGFFSFPHYFSTPAEVKLATKRFDILYQTFKSKKVSYMLQGFRFVKLVPTPMDYIGSIEDADKLSNNLKKYSKEKLMSIFFHPYLEYKYINIKRENLLRPIITYEENTILQKIINAIQDNGGEFATIFDVK
jgi:hypothetical protein